MHHTLITPLAIENSILLTCVSMITTNLSPEIEQTHKAAHEIVIFFGACSGVVLGKVTARTPFSMDALISSG